MQQISEKSARSARRPLIWITLAFHLAIGAYLYFETQTDRPAGPSVEEKSQVELNKP